MINKFVVQVEKYNDLKYLVTISVVDDNNKIIHVVKSLQLGNCDPISVGYVIDNVYVTVHELAKRVLILEKATQYLQYLYKPGDMVFYKENSEAEPIFGIVEANEFKEDHLFVRLEYNEGYYFHVSTLDKIG